MIYTDIPVEVRGTRDDRRSKSRATIALLTGRRERLLGEVDRLADEIAAHERQWQEYVADRDARLLI